MNRYCFDSHHFLTRSREAAKVLDALFALSRLRVRQLVQITQIRDEPKLLKVTSRPLPKNAGFSLEVRANMANIPSGPPQQTTLSIQTDVAPKAPSKVEVRLYNSKQQTLAAGSKADQPVP